MHDNLGMENFFSPKIRHTWGIEHCKTLSSLIDAHLQQARGELRIYEVAGPPPASRIELHIEARTPPQLSLVLGDAIHNLRASLDLMVGDLIRRANGEPDKHARFPFEKSAQQFERYRKGQLSTLCPKVFDVLCDVVKPYDEGGDELLCALHALDIQDKHLAIVPSVEALRVDDLSAATDLGPVIEHCTFAAVGGSGRYRLYEGPPGLKITNAGHIALQVVFPSGPLEGHQVIPSLERMAFAVRFAIEAMEAAALGTTIPSRPHAPPTW